MIKGPPATHIDASGLCTVERESNICQWITLINRKTHAGPSCVLTCDRPGKKAKEAQHARHPQCSGFHLIDKICVDRRGGLTSELNLTVLGGFLLPLECELGPPPANDPERLLAPTLEEPPVEP